MKLFEGDDNFGNVKLHLGFFEGLKLVKVSKEVTALLEPEHQVKLFGSLKSVEQFGEERTVDNILEDFALCFCVLNGFVLLHYYGFFEDLHGVELIFIDTRQLFDEIDSEIFDK